jgi:TolA-binding protein
VNKAFVVLGACAAGVLCPLHSFGQAGSPEPLFKEGIGYMEADNYAKAAETFEVLIKNFPTFQLIDTARLDLGVSYLFAGQYPKAIEALTPLISNATPEATRDPAQFYISQALLSYAGSLKPGAVGQHKAFEDAAAAYTRHITGFPKSTRLEESLYGRAFAYSYLDKYDDLEKDINRLLSEFPKSLYRVDYVSMLGTSYSARVVELIQAKKPQAEIDAAAKKALDTFAQIGSAPDNPIGVNDAKARTAELLFILASQSHQETEFQKTLAALYEIKSRDELIPLQTQRIKDVTAAIPAAALKGDTTEVSRLNSLRQREQSRLATLEHQPDPALQALIRIGQCFIQLDSADEARTVLRRVLNYPESSLEQKQTVNYLIILTYALQGAVDKANEAFAKHQIAYPNDSNADNISLLIGDELRRRKNYDMAIAQYAKSIKDYPKGRFVDLATIRQADSLADAGKPAEGLKVLNSFISSSPQSPHLYEAKFGVARAQLGLGKLPEALKAFRLLATDPKAGPYQAQAAYQAGAALFQVGKFDEAIAEFNGYVAKFPQDPTTPTAALFVGIAQDRKGDKAAALATLQEVVKKYPNDPVAVKAIEYIAGIYAAQNKTEEMLAAYRSIIEKYPKSDRAPAAYFKIGDHYEKNKNYDEASKNFQQVIDSKNPVFAALALLRKSLMYANAAAGLGAYVALEEDQKKAWGQHLQQSDAAALELLQTYPQSPETTGAIKRLSDNALLRNRYELLPDAQLQGYFGSLAEKFSDPAMKVRLQLAATGLIYEKGDKTAALRNYKELLSANPDVVLSPDDLNRYGILLAEAKELDAAMAQFQKLQLSYPKDQYAQADSTYGQGLVHFLKGDTTKAATFFTRLEKEFSWSPKIWEVKYVLGLAAKEKRDSKTALDYFRAVIMSPASKQDLKAKSYFASGEILEKDRKLLPDPQKKDEPNAVGYYLKTDAFYGAAMPEVGAEALWRAAQIYEKAGDAAQAGKTYGKLVKNYPKSPWAAKAKDKATAPTP